ncbi:MAG: SGNH/GDSL hydrolase family protein, partial [Planctomycetota bacterium]
LAAGLKPGKRTYMLYLPLYNGVESLEVGVERSATFAAMAPREDSPILFYGTSITHGACASRPGMAYPSILSRRFDRPVLNLGFSGNGRMDPEVGELLAEVDPCIYVVDCMPNMNAEMLAERTEPLVRGLRKARPETPILLVEGRAFTNDPWRPAHQEHHIASCKAQRSAFERLMESGIGHLHYMSGDMLLGDDGEGAVDGSHPTDLGMFRYADALEPVLRRIL